MPRDLAAETFLALRNVFFDSTGTPTAYKLRPKASAQDDPFDEYVANRLDAYFRANHQDAGAIKSPGPLVSPDMLIYRPSFVRTGNYVAPPGDRAALLALEVKKVARTTSGRVARASGIDYNTTPPCGLVRVYGPDSVPVAVHASYLFACQESNGQEHRLTALVLCDGNALNEDVDLYLSVVGQRRKEIGLGTYGDGLNRVRPMFVFGNPLGSPLFDRNATLIHGHSDIDREYQSLRVAGTFRRTTGVDESESREFYCYRDERDCANARPFDTLDPFPVPDRSRVTQARGKFKLPWSVASETAP